MIDSLPLFRHPAVPVPTRLTPTPSPSPSVAPSIPHAVDSQDLKSCLKPLALCPLLGCESRLGPTSLQQTARHVHVRISVCASVCLCARTFWMQQTSIAGGIPSGQCDRKCCCSRLGLRVAAESQGCSALSFSLSLSAGTRARACAHTTHTAA